MTDTPTPADKPAPQAAPTPPVGNLELSERVVKVGNTTPEAWKTICLTSPLTKGHGTAEIQYLLTRNRFDQDFKPGTIDGVYGQHTAHAVFEAKYWLGYRIHGRDWNGCAGADLRGYLLPTLTNGVPTPGALRLPAARRLRRAWRLRAAARRRANPLPVKAFGIAKSYVGYQGTGEAGICSIFGEEYGLPCSNWCAEFASVCITKAGGKFHYSYVPNIVYSAELRQGGLRLVTEPKRGTLVCYDWTSDGIWDHVEFFDEWMENGVSFFAVGGNTGETGGIPGGQVLHSLRYATVRHCFVEYDSKP